MTRFTIYECWQVCGSSLQMVSTTANLVRRPTRGITRPFRNFDDDGCHRFPVGYCCVVETSSLCHIVTQSTDNYTSGEFSEAALLDRSS